MHIEKRHKTSVSRNQFSRQLGGDCGIGAESVGLGRETLHAGMLGVVASLVLCVVQSLVHAVTLATDISQECCLKHGRKAYLAVVVGLLVAAPGLFQVEALKHVSKKHKERRRRKHTWQL